MEKIQILSYYITVVSGLAVTVSVIIALKQLFLMKISYQEEYTRNLRQGTIEFYNEINKELKDFIYDVTIKKIDLSLDKINSDEVLHRKVCRYLSLMERFSVGINSHMYDIRIFDRIQGKTTLLMYDALRPYIHSISEKYGPYFYREFFKVINQIEKIREERCNAGYSRQSEDFPIYEKK